MGTTAQKGAYLNQTKMLLKDKINALGGSIDDETTFREYANQLDAIYDHLPKTSFEEGETITLENTLKGKLDFDDGKVGFGQAKQETTQGYNLLPMDTPTAFEFVDNYYINKISAGYFLTYGIQLRAGVTYYSKIILYTKPVGSTSFSYYKGTDITSPIQGWGHGNIQGYNLNQVYTSSFTPTEDMTLTIRTWGNANNETYKFQLWITTDNSKDTFEPYTGGYASPSPNWEQEIKGVAGRNKADPSKLNLGKTLSNTGALIDLHNRTTSFQNQVEPNTSYALSVNSGYQIGNLFYYDKNKTYSSSVESAWANSKVITIPNNAYYVSFATARTDNATMTESDVGALHLQIEEGTQATPYLPYNTIEETIRSKNVYKSQLYTDNVQILAYRCTVALNNDEWAMTATEADAYVGELIASGQSYNSNRGFKIYRNGHSKISFRMTNTNFRKNIFTAYDKNNVSLGWTGINNDTGTYTFPDGCEYVTFRFGNGTASVGTTYKTKIMMAYGDTIPDYEPYKTPKEYQLSLGDRKPIEIGDYRDYIGRSTGKNKAQIELEGKYREYRYGSIQTNADFNGYIASVKPNTSYIANGNGLVNYPARLSNLCFFDSEMTYIDGNAYTSADKTFTTPNNCYYVTIAVSNYISNFQIEEGSIATNFEPFGVGVWYEYKNIGSKIFTGANDEGWTAGEYGTNSYYAAIDGAYKNVQDADDVMCLANIFRGVRFFYRTTSGDNIIYLTSGGQMYIRNTSYASLADFKAMLSTNNMIAYYVLDVPEITPITGELATQLEAFWNGQSLDDTTIIEGDGDLSMIVNISALKGAA